MSDADLVPQGDEPEADETVLIDTTTAAKFLGMKDPRSVRKRIVLPEDHPNHIAAQMIGKSYFIPVKRSALLAKGMDPDEVAHGAAGDVADPRSALAVPHAAQVPAVADPVDMTPIAELIDSLTARLEDRTAAAAKAEEQAKAAAREAEQARAREEEAREREREALERAAAAERELESMRNALVLREDTPWWKKLLGGG